MGRGRIALGATVRCAVIASIAVVVACQAIAGIEDLEVGDCKGGDCESDGGAGETDSAPREDTGALPIVDGGLPCPDKPPVAVRVGPPGNTFCIDTTEVSNAQYQAFLDAKVDPKTQPRECDWNASFAPKHPPDAGVRPDDPVTYVDWCDARAYCAWAGKYLCGKVENGKKVGPVTLDTLSDYKSHQWMLACSAEGRFRYPYGGLFDIAQCNLADRDAGGVLPVGTAPGCVGGYAGLHDLVGNVWEWFDGPCRADRTLEVDGGDGGPASDNCLLKGGSFANRGSGFDCRVETGNIRRDYASNIAGFRCCSD